jgi:hypothetical protein
MKESERLTRTEKGDLYAHIYIDKRTRKERAKKQYNI